MILILISYLFIIYITLGLGVLSAKWINLKDYNLLFVFLIGLFIQLIASSIYSIFFPLDAIYFTINMIVASIAFYLKLDLIKAILIKASKTLNSFQLSSKILFLFIILGTLIHSSSLPFLADNESYYIQTIKWLNNYGLVKGVSNLHPFLGQFSGWHLLQASFNFNFITPNLNDLNGLLIIMVCFFCLERWELYQVKKNFNDLYISLFSSILIVLFFFIASPSPDLPIIILTPIIIYLFLESFRNNNGKHLNLITIIILLAVLIKVTIAPILILLLFLIFKTQDRENLKFPIIISLISFIAFISKNLIISGYPLYPLLLGGEYFDLDWKLNYNLRSMFFWEARQDLSLYEKFKLWINEPNLHGLINKVIILTLILFPILNLKDRKMLLLYCFFIFQFIVLFLTSPQYRFFIPVILSIYLLFITSLVKNRSYLPYAFSFINVGVILLIGITGVTLLPLTQNKIMSKKDPFYFSQVLAPRSITQFEDLEFEENRIQNLKFYSPGNKALFIWQTSDGPLPCVNKNLIDYFSEYMNHIPQLRSENLKDGFYSLPSSK